MDNYFIPLAAGLDLESRSFIYNFIEALIFWITNNTIFGDTAARIILTIGFFVTIWILKKILLKLSLRKVERGAVKYMWRKVTSYFIWIVYLIFLWEIWFDHTEEMLAVVGVASAVFAIAFKDLILNVVAWFYVVVQGIFGIGDRIEVGKVKGDVIDMGPMQFTLMEVDNWVYGEQNTGRVLHVPNRVVFSKNVANYTRGFRYIWHEVTITVNFESNWQKAKGILQEVLDKKYKEVKKEAEKEIEGISEKYMLKKMNLKPVVYTDVIEYGVQFILRYLTKPRHRRTSEYELWEKILPLFAENEDIDFAYPTRRTFAHRFEGKPELAKKFLGRKSAGGDDKEGDGGG